MILKHSTTGIDQICGPKGRECVSLHAASQKGYLDRVKLLLKYGADINFLDHGGLTALHYVILGFKNKTCKLEDAEQVLLTLLRSKNIKVNVKTSNDKFLKKDYHH